LHGAANQPVVALLEEVSTSGSVAKVIGERLRRGERIPGLGHKIYRRVDPRAEILLGLIRNQPLPPQRWEVVEDTVALLRNRFTHVVNIDFALGALVWAAGLDLESAECLFAIARSAGWVAHAIEEYGEEPLRFRPVAVYTGSEGRQGARRDS
jgi:citrate synthase